MTSVVERPVQTSADARSIVAPTVGERVAMIGLVVLSAIVGLGALPLLRGWTSIAAVSVTIALWQPRWAIAMLLAILPIFGNKPGTRQMQAIVLLGSCLNVGVALRALVSWPWPSPSASATPRSRDGRNPIFVILALWGVASLLTLSSLPLQQIWIDSVDTLHGAWNPSAYVSIWLKSPEIDPAYSLVSVILTWYAIALAFFIRREVLANSSAAVLFARGLLVGLVGTVVIGVLDFYALVDLRPVRELDPVVNIIGYQRLQSTFGHSGWLAEYLVMSLSYLMVVLIGSRSWRWATAAIVALLLLIEFGLILTYQRGGWISHVFPLVAIWLAIFSFSQQNREPLRATICRSMPKLLLAAPLTVLVASVIFVGVVKLGWFGSGGRFDVSSYLERATSLFDTSNRSMYLSTGLQLGTLHPVLGGGSEAFGFIYTQEYLRPGGMFYDGRPPMEWLYGSAHNVYLQTLTGKGIVGLALLLALLGYVVIGGFRILWTHDDLPRSTVLLMLAAIGSAVGFACYGVVQEVFYIQTLQYVMFATFAIAGALAEPWLQIRRRTVRLLWAGLAVTFLLHLAFEYGYPGRTRDRAFWQEAGRENRLLGITELDGSGTRFKWSGTRAFLYLPSSARVLSLPLRTLAPMPQTVEIQFQGRTIDRVTLADHAWHAYRYPLPAAPWYMRSHRLELIITPTWQPQGDPRQLGVMVGQYSWQ
jgi:hypothetical protein